MEESNQSKRDEPDEANSNENRDPDSLSGLLDHFVESTEGQDCVKIQELLESLNSRSHGPMLLFPAIIAISPIGMIPGMSIVTGTLILLIATQMMLFSRRPWIPKRLEEFQFSREKLQNGVAKSKPWVKWFEKAVHHRLDFLATGIVIYPVAIICVLLALSFYPLAFVPFGVFIPGFAVTMFALGLTARDGLLVAFGLVLTATVAATIWYTWPF
ncbi:MAG: exopolysaccharide biosynthesis protein [Mariniblastus sp.]